MGVVNLALNVNFSTDKMRRRSETAAGIVWFWLGRIARSSTTNLLRTYFMKQDLEISTS